MALAWALPFVLVYQNFLQVHGAKATLPAHPRIYFADVPDYYKSNPFEPKKGGALDDRTLGSHLLGNLISREGELWTTHWSVVDLWWIKQIFISPLRVHDYAQADIVFVAAVLDPQMTNDEQCSSFFETFAPKHLPFLKSKPHILVLSHGLVYQNPGWEGKHPRCWQHPHARYFTILSQEALAAGVNPQPVGSDWANFVAFPMMARSHFHRGGLRLWEKFDAEAMLAQKSRLVFSSFLVKRYPAYPSRTAAHAQCLAAPRLCEHYNFDLRDEPHSISEAQKGFERSWYALMPEADFKIRNSFYDALAALCLPVVFEADVMRHLPFTDMVDYSKFVRYVDESLFVPEGTNASVVEILAEQHIEADALGSLKTLHNIAHVFQYMENPAHELIRFDQRNLLHPEDDAFTFTMKAVLRNLCKRGKFERKRCRAFSRIHGTIRLVGGLVPLGTEGKETVSLVTLSTASN